MLFSEWWETYKEETKCTDSDKAKGMLLYSQNLSVWKAVIREQPGPRCESGGVYDDCMCNSNCKKDFDAGKQWWQIEIDEGKVLKIKNILNSI